MGRPRHKIKEFEAVLREAESRGWTVTLGGNGHYKMYCPCARKCKKTMPSTPSDPNCLRHLLGQLKRVTCW
ncbi:hypothetical protein DP939_34970 [Spongiactinospora rosea]|uniref:HicA-like toxin n=1 Tax=Spongiactinospora rosea TaxID=2248750 RepID=A0A366LP08_9ACTN|nr:hypothetical protein DP939_34970 [Spongiactinospora rosea]